MARSRLVQGVVLGLALLALLAALGERAGLVAIARPPGQGFWLASRSAGISAYVALTLEMVAGLALGTGALDALVPRARSVEMHRFLSTASLALIAAHALALLGDRVVRFDLLDVTVPFFSRYRSAAVGVGTVAAYAIVVVHASFALRQRLGARAWRALHKLSFLAFAAATAHGLWAGSDARRPWMLGMYLLASGVVGALLAVRLRGLASGAARGRSARA